VLPLIAASGAFYVSFLLTIAVAWIICLRFARRGD
jgi:hypothetical protein